MNEKQVALQIFNELKERNKQTNFVSMILKPDNRPEFAQCNIIELKKQANYLGYNIFELNEIKSDVYKKEKGNTLIATYYDVANL